MNTPGTDEVWAALPEARVVGGAVRDALAGCAVADVDFASPLAPEEVMARAKAAGLKPVPTGIAHGTITVVARGRGFEVTTLRRDVETDGRHAVVAFTDDWREDAARRDFTINAMSMDRAGTVYDYFGGREDLAAGRVRFVGAAAARVQEDYLRILRFFRFYARYAKGAPDAEAVAAIVAHKDGLATLSVERVWSEIKLILKAADPRGALALMRETGVLEMVLPGADEARLGALVARGAPVEPLLRVAALVSEDVGCFAVRLKLSGEEREWLAAWRRPATLSAADDDAALRRALAREPAEVLVGRTWLSDGGAELRERLRAMDRPVFPLRGRDLVALGVAPGPELGAALHAVEEWWLAGGCVADAAACRAWYLEHSSFR
jgi:poly(A) polymerase/tRNA nucleotidyltransferase (CCA-adding enzyme)